MTMQWLFVVHFALLGLWLHLHSLRSLIGMQCVVTPTFIVSFEGTFNLRIALWSWEWRSVLLLDRKLALVWAHIIIHAEFCVTDCNRRSLVLLRPTCDECRWPQCTLIDATRVREVLLMYILCWCFQSLLLPTVQSIFKVCTTLHFVHWGSQSECAWFWCMLC